MGSREVFDLAVRKIGIAGKTREDGRKLAAEIGLVPRRVLDPKKKLAIDEARARSAYNWLASENRPSFEQTLALLDRAGLLVPEASAALRGEKLSARELADRTAAQLEGELEALAPESTKASKKRRPRTGERPTPEEGQE